MAFCSLFEPDNEAQKVEEGVRSGLKSSPGGQSAIYTKFAPTYKEQNLHKRTHTAVGAKNPHILKKLYLLKSVLYDLMFIVLFNLIFLSRTQEKIEEFSAQIARIERSLKLYTNVKIDYS